MIVEQRVQVMTRVAAHSTQLLKIDYAVCVHCIRTTLKTIHCAR